MGESFGGKKKNKIKKRRMKNFVKNYFKEILLVLTIGVVIFLLVKILSRAPQLLHMTTTPNTEVFRASLINTLKYMCRDNSKIIPPNDHCLHVPFFAIIAYIDCTTIQKYNNYLIAM
jgi:hypothetical protein